MGRVRSVGTPGTTAAELMRLHTADRIGHCVATSFELAAF
jgi:hypothetical protein